MSYERDPLSPRYDKAAAGAVSKAIEAGGGGYVTTLADPSDRLVQWSIRRGVDPLALIYVAPKGARARGLGAVETEAQAAFRRACYYDPRIYLRSASRSYRLVFRWGRRTARGREVRLRAYPLAARVPRQG